MPFSLCFGFSTRGERSARAFLLFICSSIVKKWKLWDPFNKFIERRLACKIMGQIKKTVVRGVVDLLLATSDFVLQQG